MLDRNKFVVELDESTQATIKEMVMDALNELGVYEYEMVETAMSGRLCDLEDLINLDEISKNEISDIQEIKMLEYLEMILGSETLLQEMASALNNDALKENLEYIARMHDIDLKPIEK